MTHGDLGLMRRVIRNSSASLSWRWLAVWAVTPRNLEEDAEGDKG